MIKVSLAVVIGASTHLLWDSFTHQGRWGTRLFPTLDETAMTISGHPVPGFKLLQYGSTILGFPVLIFVLAIWLSRRKVESGAEGPGLSASARKVAWLVAAMIPLVATSLVGVWGDGTPYRRLGQSITLSGLGLMIAVMAYCLVHRWFFQGTFETPEVNRSAQSTWIPLLRRVVSAIWMTLVLGMSILCLSSYFAYTTLGFDFEEPTAMGVDATYKRLRWDDGSTWIGQATQSLGRPDHELEWFDPGGTLLAAPTRPAHRAAWNILGFWQVDGPRDDPYVAIRYPGASESRWWACPSWLVLAALWHRQAWLSVRWASSRAWPGRTSSRSGVDS